MIMLADGTRANVGDDVFNYYDMVPVKILRTSCSEITHEATLRAEIPCDGCGPKGWYWTSDGKLLNGERMCSLETARRKGYLRD